MKLIATLTLTVVVTSSSWFWGENADDEVVVGGLSQETAPGSGSAGSAIWGGGSDAQPVGGGSAKPYCPPRLFSYGEYSELITECDGAGGTEMVPWLERAGAEEGASPEDVIIEPVVVTRSDVQSLLVHSGSLTIQPDRSWVLVNAETIAMTDASEHVLATQVLGLDVDVRVAPALYTWDFGDGAAPVAGTDPGAAWPNHTVSHVYRSEGEAAITLRTEWDAAFRVEGTGVWVPVEGRAVTVTTSDPIEVVSAVPRLTAGR